MCGVFGYIGKRDAVTVCYQGLELLEYRGYDSSGIAGIINKKISFQKKAGKLSELKKILSLQKLDLAIGHTRWATHGGVSDQNAHPHVDENHSIAIIHNGIIENYSELKRDLEKEGFLFQSETDTEVIVQLIAKFYQGDLIHAVNKVVSLLHGVYSFLAIHKDHFEIIGVSHGCPLSVGIDEEKSEAILSSDPNTFLSKTFDVYFLDPGEIVRVQKGTVEIFDKQGSPILKKKEKIIGASTPPAKGDFEHFMLKEIFEQPLAIERTLDGRFDGKIHFEELKISNNHFASLKTATLIGSGTSFHAGLIGSLFLEDLALFPSFAEIASEAQYRKSYFSLETLILAISQSGETADTLAALRKAKKEGFPTLALCNVENSAITREADGTLFLKAGPEVSVCSTKAFTTQLSTLYLFALYLGQIKKTIDEKTLLHYFEELKKIPSLIQRVLDHSTSIEKIAKKYAHYNDFFFMGRRYMYPTCIEAALKLKEISYVNANGYPAGELKHGPIALLDENFPVVAFCANELTQEKMCSNLMEVKARKAPLLAIIPESMKDLKNIADDVIFVPDTIDPLSPFPSTVASQILAYYIAKERGCPIDQPRNLAKSVTVE